MYERTKQLIAGVEGAARDPRMLYEGKTKEEHEKALLKAAEAKAKGNLTESRTEQEVLDEAQMLATARAKKTPLVERMASIVHGCDGTRDQNLAGEGFSR
jgi:hypothetical protein